MSRVAKSPLTTQSRFWDICNGVENPIIRFFQAVLFARPLGTFWLRLAGLGSARLFSLSPLVLFCLGCPSAARRLAVSFVFYALFSSLGKFCVRRRRPLSYPGVVCLDPAPTSSFPSRHSIGVTVLAAFLWRPLQLPYVALLVADRVAAGMHYATDCLAGVALGLLALRAGEMVANANLATALLVVALQVWAGGAKILGGALPVLIAPPAAVAPACAALALLKHPLLALIRRGRKERDTLRVLTQELLVTSLILFAAVKLDGRLAAWGRAPALPWEWARRLLAGPGVGCSGGEPAAAADWRSVRGIMRMIGL
jgi:hypothetical protein